MITKRYEGRDVLKSVFRHIVFGTNIQGCNISGFAGQVASKKWPELEECGAHELGTVLTKECPPNRAFHAIVCHSSEKDDIGWKHAPEIIEIALNALEIPDGEEIACVLMGGGYVGKAMGADTEAIKAAMERSNKKIVLYS